MVALRLTARDRETLGHAARHGTDAREARRALALLDLDAGESPTRVAERYRVSRSTVYEWVARWRDADRPRGDRLRDADRSGRPPATRDAVEEVLAALMPMAPTDHGYRFEQVQQCLRWNLEQSCRSDFVDRMVREIRKKGCLVTATPPVTKSNASVEAIPEETTDSTDTPAAVASLEPTPPSVDPIRSAAGRLGGQRVHRLAELGREPGCGVRDRWPEGEARVADCELVEAYSDAEHRAMLEQWAAKPSNGRRHNVCRRQLEELNRAYVGMHI